MIRAVEFTFWTMDSLINFLLRFEFTAFMPLWPVRSVWRHMVACDISRKCTITYVNFHLL